MNSIKDSFLLVCSHHISMWHTHLNAPNSNGKIVSLGTNGLLKVQLAFAEIYQDRLGCWSATDYQTWCLPEPILVGSFPWCVSRSSTCQHYKTPSTCDCVREGSRSRKMRSRRCSLQGSWQSETERGDIEILNPTAYENVFIEGQPKSEDPKHSRTSSSKGIAFLEDQTHWGKCSLHGN